MVLPKHIRSLLIEHNITEQTGLVVGVSGGVDSMVLLDVLHQLPLRLEVCHLNYKTRGADSDADQRLVESYCASKQIPIHVRVADKSKAENNFQNWARKQRYDFFEEIRQQKKCRYVVTAHHKDDQIETILLKVLRGAAPGSWQGMEVLSDSIFRPFLHVGKKSIAEYARINKLAWREDTSNQSNDYARNLIRNELADQLHDLLPGWQSNILGLSDYGAQYEDLIDRISEDYVRQNRISREWMIDQPEYLISAVIHRIIKNEFPDLSMGISKSALESVNELREIQTGKKIRLSDDLEVFRSRNEFIVRAVPDVKEAVHHKIEADQLPVEIQLHKKLRLTSETFQTVKEDTIQLHLGVLGRTFTIRNWQHGDAIKPLGMQGHQKISDLIINKKIPSEKKNEVFVVQAFDESICAVILPAPSENLFPAVISEDAKCRSGDKSLVIQKTA